VNIYVVTSGPIEYVEHVPGMFGGPMMEYSIGEIVAAETRGGAKWVAWRADKTSGWGCGVTDMPNLHVKLLRKGVRTPAGRVGPEYDYLWWCTEIPRAWVVPDATLIANYLDWTAEETHGGQP
jgi:hypothetical protein